MTRLHHYDLNGQFEQLGRALLLRPLLTDKQKRPSNLHFRMGSATLTANGRYVASAIKPRTQDSTATARLAGNGSSSASRLAVDGRL